MSKDKNISGVVQWLQEANRQSLYVRYIQQNLRTVKIKLPETLQNLITLNDYCGWYAQLLDNYINDVKTDYD